MSSRKSGKKGQNGSSQKAARVGSLHHKGQEQILAVLDGSRGTFGSRPTVDLDSKRLARKVEGLHDRLAGLGFREQQIELAIRACCLDVQDERGLTFESLLDWLLLRLPPSELPAQFTDAATRDGARSTLKLDVAFTGGGARAGGGVRLANDGEFDVPSIAHTPARRSDADEGVDKSWILAYVEKQREAELESARAAKAQETAALRWATLPPQEKLMHLEASYEEEKQKASVAKEQGKLGRRDKAELDARLKDIREQITELRIIVGQQKKEMKKFKDQLLATPDPVRSTGRTAPPQPQHGSSQCNDQIAVEKGCVEGDAEALGCMFDDDGDEEEDETPSTACQSTVKNGDLTSHTTKQTTINKSAFEHSVVDGLFGDESDDEDDEPVARHTPAQCLPPPQQRESARPPQPPPRPNSPDRAVPGALDEMVSVRKASGAPSVSTSSTGAESVAASADPEETEPVPARPAGVPKNWTGKTPRRVLEEHMQKRKLGKLNFQRGADDSCVLVLPVGGKTFESVGEFDSHADACHAAATRALYFLTPQLQMDKVLPPPFRDWWREWVNAAKQQKQQESAAVKKSKRDRATNIVESVRSAAQAQQQDQAPLSKAAEVGQEKKASLDVVTDNWEDEAEEITPTEADSAGKGQELRKRFEAMRATPEYQELGRVRASLPAAQIRDDLLACIARERVLVIHGETGSGKSTQVPQFILEQALQRGEGHKVRLVVTQPRRVAAITLAERVAREMGESAGPSSRSLVGYQIRMESKAGRDTRILFCTTGILLRRLQSDPQLQDVTHVVLDEVHERQALGDFLLIVLRELLNKRQDLRLILMSATFNADLFCQYFGGCPSFSIPGRTYPVQDLYLEDALDMTAHGIEEGSPCALRQGGPRYKSTSVEMSARGGKTFNQRVWWEEEDWAIEGERGANWAEYMDALRSEAYRPMTVKSMSRVNESKINYDLIEDLIRHIADSEEEMVDRGEQGWRRHGAVLVFLPGLGEIRSLLDRLKVSRIFGNERAFHLLPLHSALSSQDQQKIFRRPPPGVRKIVLSTNIAETSVTIDDVAYVIDSGLVREIQLARKGRTGARALVLTWCPRASAKQRMGRAGRVAPGLCFRLFSRYTYDHVMHEFAIPELQRTPLEELCLQARACNLAPSAREFLLQAPEPPSTAAIDSAIRVLQDVGALQVDGTLTVSASDSAREGVLTPLGRHLSKLPMDVRLGKMLVLAALFRCLDPVLTIAAALSGSKSPLLTPIGKEQEARAQHSRFEVRQSDFLTLVNVFAQYRLTSKEGNAAENRFCSQHFLSRTVLKEMQDLKAQYLSLLIDQGLVAKPSDFRSDGVTGSYGVLEAFMNSAAAKKDKGVNAEAGNTNLVLAVVAAGLYPNVVRAYPQTGGGKPTFSHGPSDRPNSTVYLHGSSVLNPLTDFSSPWLVFHERFETARAYVHPASVVSPYALLLFGGPLVVDHLNNRVTIAEWIQFSCSARTAVLFRELRRRLIEVLEELIRTPLVNRSKLKGGEGGHEAVVDTVVSLMQEEEKTAWIPGSKDDPDRDR